MPQGPQVVRRHTCHDRGLVVLVQQVQVGAGPTVGAVVGNENGQVAHDEHATLIGVALQGRALFVKTPLHKPPKINLLDVGAARLSQCIWATPGKVFHPGPPGLAVVGGLQRHEQAVVVQPVGLGLAPMGIGLPIRWACVRKKARCRATQLCQPPGHHPRKIHSLGGKPAQRQLV